LPAALALCVAVAACLVAAKPWREANPLRQMAWLVLLVLGLHSMTEYPLWYGPFQIACGLALGIVFAQNPSHTARQVRFKTPITRVFKKFQTNVSVIWSFIAIKFIVISSYMAWDYQRVGQIYLPPEERLPQYAQDTMAHVNQSFVFQKHARFAQLMLLPPDAANAQQALQLASELVHYSPEPRVIERLIEAATLLGKDELALQHMARYRSAHPADYAKWQPTGRAALPITLPTTLPLTSPSKSPDTALGKPHGHQ
jgi:Virulence factor membrane-bound polymerase, C-terminal